MRRRRILSRYLAENRVVRAKSPASLPVRWSLVMVSPSCVCCMIIGGQWWFTAFGIKKTVYSYTLDFPAVVSWSPCRHLYMSWCQEMTRDSCAIPARQQVSMSTCNAIKKNRKSIGKVFTKSNDVKPFLRRKEKKYLQKGKLHCSTSNVYDSSLFDLKLRNR